MSSSVNLKQRLLSCYFWYCSVYIQNQEVWQSHHSLKTPDCPTTYLPPWSSTAILPALLKPCIPVCPYDPVIKSGPVDVSHCIFSISSGIIPYEYVNEKNGLLFSPHGKMNNTRWATKPSLCLNHFHEIIPPKKIAKGWNMQQFKHLKVCQSCQHLTEQNYIAKEWGDRGMLCSCCKLSPIWWVHWKQ